MTSSSDLGKAVRGTLGNSGNIGLSCFLVHGCPTV
jgi:hypothetical protein